MKLYRGQIEGIARDVIQKLVDEQAIEILEEQREEAENDLKAIMVDYLRRDSRLRNEVQEYMGLHQISFDRRGEISRSLAKERRHPLGNRVLPYFINQFTENCMLSAFVDEVYSDDATIKGLIRGVLADNTVDESALREEARALLSNLDEHSMEFQIRFPEKLQEIRRKKGLI